MSTHVVKKRKRAGLAMWIAAKARGAVRLVRRSAALVGGVRPLPEIAHLVFSPFRAFVDLIANREVARRICCGYYADKLVVVAAMPKSASSVIGSCVAELMSVQGIVNRSYASYMRANADSDLRPEMVKDFANGGVIKYHTRASSKNLKVLELLGVKYIILFRHPLDQIVAVYCHSVHYCQTRDLTNEGNLLKDHIYPLPIELFRGRMDIHDSLRYMLREGYLIASLGWMVDWLRFRDPKKSAIVKYEDFMLKREKMLDELSLFLVGRPVEKRGVSRSIAIADAFASDRARTEDRNVYSRGWTGKIGTWKDYVSDQNRDEYISVVRGFLSYYPDAELLLGIYPDLVDVEKSCVSDKR